MNGSCLIGERLPKVTFGTSGVCTLVSDLNTEAGFSYVYAFMQQMRMAHGSGLTGQRERENSDSKRSRYNHGIRLTFSDGDIVHLRVSGNAPELGCYAEATNLDAAKSLCVGALSRVR